MAIASYSDLLLSIAVAQWKQVDARAEIHRLVDELNRMGTGLRRAGLGLIWFAR
jgi:hypothetical protein